MRPFLLFLAVVSLVNGQAVNVPVIFARGVTDATRQDPAPATVARGGMLQLTGFNLGPDPELKAAGVPLPTVLGEAKIQVLINGTAAPLYSVSKDRIVAQVPVDAAPGVASVVVKAGDVASAPQTFTVAAVQPGIVSKDGSGFGVAAGEFSKSPVTLSGTGFGATNPRAGTVVAYVGGNPAKVTTKESKTIPGLFEALIEVPGQARPGDLAYITVNSRPANPVVLQPLAAADVQFVKLPDGAPDLAQIVTPDVSGMFVLGTAVKDSKGCFPAFTFDFSKKQGAASNPCLIGPANALTPFVNATGTEYVAAFIGPAAGTAPAGIAKQVLIYSPGKAERTADLSGAASVLGSGAGGTFTATIPAATTGGTVIIDTITAASGTVRTANAPAGVGGVAATPVAVSVDGLTKLLTARITIPGGMFAVVVADDTTKPTRVEFAILKTNGEKVSATPLPSGLVPLLAPPAPPQGNAASPFVGATGLAFYLAEKKAVYVAAKMPDDSAHAFISFPADGSDPTVVNLPAGWFLAACTNAIRTYNFVLGKQLGLFASNSGVNTYKASCPASGFVEVNIATGALSAVALPSNSDMVVGAATGNFNDFLYGTNFSATARTASTIFAIDGSDGSPIKLDPPTGISAFQAPTAIPAMDALIALGLRRAAGDIGFAFFDLANGTAKQLALPDGFATVSFAGFFPATRKILARGISADRKTSNLVIYDVLTGNSSIVANPDGVASVAGKPGAVVSPRLMVTNANANTVSAVGFDADGKQVGVLTVRIP
jgi:uncharacterized protein (TIGR03437 family)